LRGKAEACLPTGRQSPQIFYCYSSSGFSWHRLLRRNHFIVPFSWHHLNACKNLSRAAISFTPGAVSNLLFTSMAKIKIAEIANLFFSFSLLAS
jgi:hypothetical protein